MNVREIQINQDQARLIAAGFAGGVVVGGAVAHILTKRRLQAEIVQLEGDLRESSREVHQMADALDYAASAEPRERFANKVVGKPELDELLKEHRYTRAEQDAIDEIVAQERADAAMELPEPEIEEMPEYNRDEGFDPEEHIDRGHLINVFDPPANEDNWNWAEEESSRTNELPYVIHYDEWQNNEYNLDRSSLTYYAGDDTLVDENNKPVDQDDVVGVKHLGMFGHGSRDPEKIYVRNPELSIEFEVFRMPGKYSHQELAEGMDDDMQRFLKRRSREPRDDE